ncbi:MAG TPA: DUF4389 domain-containing protein [Solirubrobacteraceae bacterium]|nr:DUF4389 domain-containing protein [Solirubrobacteraceae bacterium]
MSAVHERPVHLIVRDEGTRSPLTVFFRLILVIPHLIWLSLWGIAAAVAVIINWFATLFAGQSPQGLHLFLAAYIRYAIHVGAYLFLVADPYPDFGGSPGYPVDVEIAPPQPQNRWTVAFRLILAIPAILLASALASTGRTTGGYYISFGLLGIVAFLGWFACLARSRMPRGFRDAAAYALAYSAQLDAYLFLLTDRYPNGDPLAALDEIPVRSDPIRLPADENLHRSRVTVFFRLLLAIPHLIWLYLWGIVAFFAVIANWFATLFSGRSPEGLHRFLSAYLRYAIHVYAYLLLSADPFPEFVGREGSYPVDLSIEGPRDQNRWTVGFRIVLALPAAVVTSAYSNVAYIAAFLGWFAALATGEMPRGLRNAQILALRYHAQTYGYIFLLTESYPYSGPSQNAVPVTDVPEVAPMPMPA